MGCEGRQICDCDSLRILADWRLIEGVFGRSKSRCSYVDRNHCKPLSCRICFDNATSDLNREKILRKDGLKCGLCMVNRYFDLRAKSDDVLSNKAKVCISRDCEVTRSHIVNSPCWEIFECDSFRIVANRGLVELVIACRQGRLIDVVAYLRNHFGWLVGCH